MNIARLRVSLLSVTALLMAVQARQACTCMAPATAAEAFHKSSAVFRGRVTKIYQSLWDAAGVTRTGNHRVKFEVMKQWKGPRAKSIVVVTRLTGEACGFPFEEKKEYLVCVAAGPANIETGICTGTKSIVDAATELEQLDRLVSKNSK